MSAPPYMKLFWGDYHRKTRHLTQAAQHGAYLLLIGEAWQHAGSLPDDDNMLSAWACCSLEQWALIKPIVMDFFSLRRGKWVHDRVREELAVYETTSRKRKEAGKRGGSSSIGKHDENKQAIASGLPTNAGAFLEPEPKPYTSEDKSSSVCFPEKRKRRASTMASEIQTAFDDWWSYYPLKKSKADALKAFPKALELAGALEVLVAATKRYATEVIGLDPSKIKHPSGWLNGRRWEDEPASQQGLIINGRTAQPSNNHTAKRDRMLRAIVSLSDRDSRWRSGD